MSASIPKVLASVLSIFIQRTKRKKVSTIYGRLNSEVLDFIRSPAKACPIIDAAYREVACNDKWLLGTFIASFDAVISAQHRAHGITPIQSRVRLQKKLMQQWIARSDLDVLRAELTSYKEGHEWLVDKYEELAASYGELAASHGELTASNGELTASCQSLPRRIYRRAVRTLHSLRGKGLQSK